jgi:hypothetical protein
MVQRAARRAACSGALTAKPKRLKGLELIDKRRRNTYKSPDSVMCVCLCVSEFTAVVLLFLETLAAKEGGVKLDDGRDCGSTR